MTSPSVMQEESVRGIMRTVLSRSAPSNLKIRALNNLHDMMQVCHLASGLRVRMCDALIGARSLMGFERLWLHP